MDEYPIDCETCGNEIICFEEDFNGMCYECYDMGCG